MAVYIPATARTPLQLITQANGQSFTLEALQHYVEGYVEETALTADLILYANEEATMQALPINRRATELMWKHRLDRRTTVVRGNALVASKAETGDTTNHEAIALLSEIGTLHNALLQQIEAVPRRLASAEDVTIDSDALFLLWSSIEQITADIRRIQDKMQEVLCELS